MYAGRKVEEATPPSCSTIRGHPLHQGPAGLDPASRHRARTDTRRAKLNEIKGMVPSLFNLPPGCSFAPRCAFATDQCRNHKPPLEEQRPRHWIACWHADRVLSGVAVGAA
jgi:oligopeptide/dipeptide ABC transporter ATP-binding protein